MTVFEKMKADIAEMPVQEFADIYIKCCDVPKKFQCCEKEGKEWGEDFTCSSCKRAWLESETLIAQIETETFVSEASYQGEEHW